MFRNSVFLALFTLSTFFLSQDLAADRRDDHDVLRRYENRGDLDYRQNWVYDRNAYLSGESPFQPSWEREPNGYYYRGQYYQSGPISDRPYHRGDWGNQRNWRYNENDKQAYLRGVNDQSDYYRQTYGQGTYYNNNGYYNNNYYNQQPSNYYPSNYNNSNYYYNSYDYYR